MKYLIFLLVGIISLNLINASDMNIKIDMDENQIQGQNIEFNYTIDLNYVGDVEYFYNIKCEGLPDSLLDLKRVHSGGDEILGSFGGFKADQKYENCVAFVSVISPFKIEARKNFNIFGDSAIGFNINICKSSSCVDESRVFIKDEDIYFDYFSDISELSIDAMVKYPDKSLKKITLPTSIKASQVGSYELEITVSKGGYKDLTQKEQFGVIERSVEIRNAEFAGMVFDGVGKKEDFLFGKIFIWIMGGIFIVFLIVFILYLISRRRMAPKISYEN